MSRSVLILLSASLLILLVLAYAAFSLVQVEKKVYAAAEAEGRALLTAVSAGVERSLAASGTVERLTADRLLELARDAGRELGESPGREERLLGEFALHHRLKGILLLDGEFHVVASSEAVRPRRPAAMPGQPLATARLKPMVAEDLVRRARERGLGEQEEVVVGFGENPYGARVEFLVAARVAETGGYLLLRQDAEMLRDLRRDAGVERLISDSAASDAIAWLRLENNEGKILARSGDDAGTGQVIEVELPATFQGAEGGLLRVGLDPAPAEEVLRSGRESVFLFTGLLVLLGVGGAVALLIMERTAARKRDAWERELRSRERAAAMGRLAAGVAHEVRSPLNAIGMGAQRLSRDPVAREGESAEIVAAVLREVARLNRTVEEFLDLGRPRPLDREEFDPAALVREVVEAEAPAARIDAPPATVRPRGDREELRKALANLVRNARQAAGDGAVVVAWYAIRRTTCIEIRDGGPGIPDEDKSRIFEHFYTGRPGGTGLGLAIARSIAERHGGSLDVDDAPEGGACFRLSLPGENP